jgi:oxygen-independent coproporphyrinogen-3 oxidase
MFFGVYIHFPYCRRRCPYCDFAISARPRIPHERYQGAVCSELQGRAPLFAGRKLRSIYFGGGTPGLWAPESVGSVIEAVRATFPEHEGALEISLEANPEAMAPDTLAALRGAGVNRLSIGAQSLDPGHLATLGREHAPSQVGDAVFAARAAGFDNLSLDLIFGVPGQTLAVLDRDLDGLFALAPDHLSIYNLTIEERTPFGHYQREGTLRLPDAGLQADMYARVSERAAAAGFEHYEISSYARAGRRAVHNTLYWTSGEWLGLGNSAHSFRRVDGGGERFSSVRSIDEYLQRASSAGADLGRDSLVANHERLDEAALAREAIWLGLRMLTDGVDRARYRSRFGEDPVVRFAREFERLAAEGLVAIDAARARLTARGALFADEVGARFI